MMQVDGMKVNYLTTGDLTDTVICTCSQWSQKVYCEKSADVIVLEELLEEGQNVN